MNDPVCFLGHQPHSARTLALQVLLEGARHQGFVQETLDRLLASAVGLSPADRRLATQLAYGVMRRRGTLLALLRPHISRDPDNVEPWLWEALQLGAYQLALLSQIPPHAAIHETVELAVQFGRPRARGFLNAILRSLSRLLTDDRAPAPAPDALPLEGGSFRRLDRPVLPDPSTHPVEYLADGFGLPHWLALRWFERFGRDEAFRLGFWFAGPVPLTLRVNLLRISREEFLAALTQAGFAAETGDHPQAIRLREHAAVRDLPGYEEGWFSVQDLSAMQVASALAPRPGWRVLDLCAAPGGKSAHLAELMRDHGRIIASDLDERRLRTVADLAQRLRLRSILTVPAAALDPDDRFDAVLVDVPCSNTGVLGKRPEARWRLRPDEFHHLNRVQEQLLRLALQRTRRGGVVVYSTCSIEPEENGYLVRRVLRAHREWRIEAETVAIPGRPADGGYWVRVRMGP